MQPSTNSFDAAIAAAGSKATYTGAGASLSGWLLSSEAGVLIGIILGVAGLVINYVFKRREDKRLQEEHDARMITLMRDSRKATIQ